MNRLVLTADAARRIVDAGSDPVLYDIQNIAPPRHVPPTREKWRCWFTNEGRWPIAAGEAVGIIGMVDNDLSSEEAIDNWAESGLRLRVKRIGLIDDADAARLARGVALDGIPTDATGRGEAPGVFMALVWRDPDVIGESRRFLERADWKTTDWTDPRGVSRQIRRLSFVKYPGDFTVVDAAAPTGEGNVFALVTAAPTGPALDKIVSVDLAAGTAQMACGVTAAAPLDTLTASDVGKRAILVRNTVSRGWHVILGRG
ncbi:MAG: hypothetical protein J6S40_04655 [Thermoguttaceae bacterium]|nr:hypothetical protein [Thermoguttaceae bacterium]